MTQLVPGDVAKRAAAQAAAELVQPGMVLGLGTGSTVAFFLDALGELQRQGVAVSGVPTSRATAARAQQLGVSIVDLPATGVDLAVDGADMVDLSLNLIKGFGGALVRERIVAASATRFVVIVDESKLATALGGRLPLEIMPFGVERTIHDIATLLGELPVLRTAGGLPEMSDNGNLLADGILQTGQDTGALMALAAALAEVPGLVGHGLFLSMADDVLVGKGSGRVTSLAHAAEERDPGGPSSRGPGL